MEKIDTPPSPIPSTKVPECGSIKAIMPRSGKIADTRDDFSRFPSDCDAGCLLKDKHDQASCGRRCGWPANRLIGLQYGRHDQSGPMAPIALGEDQADADQLRSCRRPVPLLLPLHRLVRRRTAPIGNLQAGHA